jgi:2-C-methyl-D-erythritol 2,4-cyclodiphosphate synthase
MNIRIGTGYDVHRLTKDRPLIIGGVSIPFEKGLLGHSDADVLLHAICDALLGALALGDIGKHFPDSSPDYKNIDSRLLLKKTFRMIRDEGYHLVNLDATIMAERPKMKDFIPSMRKAIAEMLEAETSSVSIKATTTEKLGFIGREEGIAAEAVVLIARKEVE